MKVLAALLAVACAVPALALQTSIGSGNAQAAVAPNLHLSGELHIPSVPNAPFLGVLVHTAEHPGNPRTQHTEVQVARDSAGRVYQEQRTPQIAGTSMESRLVSIMVIDPVAKLRRICRQQEMECTEYPLREQSLARLTKVAAAGAQDLGAEAIGGLAVTHVRDTGTRPPRSFSVNASTDTQDTPVAVTRDTWFSPDLQTALRVTLEDEQQGTQLTELRILNRNEPDPTFFAMPKEYKLVEAPAPIKLEPLPPGVERVGNGVSSPVVLKAPEPEFSEQARRDKISGNVLVSLIVDENGRPTEVKVVRGIGHGLDEKALQAVSAYQFRPAMKAGQPVKVQLMVEVNFQRF